MTFRDREVLDWVPFTSYLNLIQGMAILGRKVQGDATAVILLQFFLRP